MENRIFFIGNPYPDGHKIKTFEWSAVLKPENGIWFDFHLVTEKYYAEDNSDDDENNPPESDWTSKVVWHNYHACTISSNFWHDGGILVGTENNKLDFENLSNLKLSVDQLPLPDDFDADDSPAFHIYLLGHDACAGHNFVIKKNKQNLFDIKWSGKICLAYSGETDFDYDFKANIYNVELKGIEIPNDLSEHEIQKILEKYSINSNKVKILNK